MTASLVGYLLLASAAPQGNRVVEVIAPEADRITLQAIVRLPELGAYDRAVVAVLGETLLEGTKAYTRFDIQDVTAGAGESPRVIVMPDHMRIVIGASTLELDHGLSVLRSILVESNLTDESIQAITESLPYRRRSAWGSALSPFRFDYASVRSKDVREAYVRFIRPENVTIAAGGPFASGTARETWARKISGWEAPRIPYFRPDTRPSAVLERSPFPTGWVEMAGPSFLGSDAALPTRLLATIALGTGKGASLWRVAREGKGMAYRQEAVLWPTSTGFVPRLVMLTTQRELPENGESLRKALAEDIGRWTEEDRQRAVGMAEAVLLGGLEMGPLYLSPSVPLRNDLVDRTFFEAYWPMKTGSPWDAGRMISLMRLVTLDDLRASASEIVSNGMIRFVPRR